MPKIHSTDIEVYVVVTFICIPCPFFFLFINSWISANDWK